MKTFFENRAVLLSLFIIAMLSGYFSFRLMYGVGDQFPFGQEILLVALGTIATILITALLLSQQTDMELRKEGLVLLLDQKSQIYLALVDHIGEIVEKGRLEPGALAELRVLNHKLAMIGGASVIRKFNVVLGLLDEAVNDQKISDQEQAKIMQAVAVLSYHMRRDLLGAVKADVGDSVLQDIIANNQELEE